MDIYRNRNRRGIHKEYTSRRNQISKCYSHKLAGNMTTRTKGFTIIEFIVAAGIFVIIATSSVVTLMQSGVLDRRGNEQEKARRYAQEGSEAVRSIRNQSFSSLAAGTYGLSSVGGTWAFSGTQNDNEGMTRTITIADVYRNSSGTIVTSGGTLDPDTKKSTVTVSWTGHTGKQLTVTSESYLTNFKKSLGCYSWGTPTQESAVAISVAHQGWKVETQGNFAYVTFSDAGTDFAIIDITDTANPRVRSTLNLTSSNQNNIAVQGDYVYLASANTSHEVLVINVANPDAPFIASDYNMTGNTDANGVYIVGSRLYVTRDAGSDKEFYVFDVTDPNDLELLGSFETGVTSVDVIVMGDYAYVATTADTQELIILNVSNPAAITKAAGYNIANSTTDARSITAHDNLVYLGMENGSLHIFDVTNASSPQLVGVYTTSGSINDIFFLSDPSCLFLATTNQSLGFVVVSVSNPAAPALIGTYSVNGQLNGVAYDSTTNRVFLTTDLSTGEFVIIRPP